MAAGNFPECETFTLAYEGGFVNNPKDPGGATNLGVTQGVYNTWRIKRDLPVRSVRFIEHAEANAIYEAQYWTPIGAEALPKGVDMLAFDIAVNGGYAKLWLEQTAHLAPIPRLHAIDAKRRGYWASLKIFRYFGKGWYRRENSCLAVALKMAA
jgi:lysozyme family protein